MILTLILGAIAGLAARMIFPQVREFSERFFEEDNMPGADELHVFSFAVSLVIAALVLWVLGAGGKSALLVVVATAAYFQKEIREALLARK